VNNGIAARADDRRSAMGYAASRADIGTPAVHDSAASRTDSGATAMRDRRACRLQRLRQQ
jgi:hypothetical protein